VMETDGGYFALPKIRASGFVRKGIRREGLSDRGIDWVREFCRCCLTYLFIFN
jgi:hypothetical protein